MADKVNDSGTTQVDLTNDRESYDPVADNQLGRVQKDDGEYQPNDIIDRGDQVIPEDEVMDDDALNIGRRYTDKDTAVNGLFDVVASPGAIGDISTREQWKQSADNLTDTDGVIENDGDEDEAMKQEEVARMSEDYGHDIHRKGQDKGVLFDTIDRHEGPTAIGSTVSREDQDEEK